MQIRKLFSNLSKCQKVFRFFFISLQQYGVLLQNCLKFCFPVGSSLHTIKADLSAQTLHDLDFSDSLLGESGPESESPYMYTCTICAKMFPRRYDLKKHLVMHNTDRKFQCPECDKMFDFSPAFDAHLREHTGELAYRCTECGERYCAACCHQELPWGMFQLIRFRFR